MIAERERSRLDAEDLGVSVSGTRLLYGARQLAVVVLHRYRDAISELDHSPGQEHSPKRLAVQAAALFPMEESQAGEFCESRLWQSVPRLGIGAIPALPSNLDYLRGGFWRRCARAAGRWPTA